MPHVAEYDREKLETLRGLLGDDNPLVQRLTPGAHPPTAPAAPPQLVPPATTTTPAQRPGGLFAETPAPPTEIAGLRAEAARIRKEAGIPEGGIRRAPGLPERATVLGLGALAAPEKQARELEDQAKQLEDINSLGARTLRAIGTVPRVGGTALSALTTGLAESAAPGSTGARPPGPLFEEFKQREGREPNLNESLSLIQDSLSLPPGFQGAAEVVGDPFILAGGFGAARGLAKLRRPPRANVFFHGTFTDVGLGADFGGIHLGTRKAALKRLEDTRPSARQGRPGGEKIIAAEVKLRKPYGSPEQPISETELALINGLPGTGPRPGMPLGGLNKLKEQGFDGIYYRNIAEDAGSLSVQVFDRSSLKILPVPRPTTDLRVVGAPQARVPGPQLPRTPRPPDAGPRFREPETSVSKLTRLITEAKPVREQTEALKSAELRRRVAAGARILERGADPRAAFGRARAPLAGPLPRAQFTPVESNLLPIEVTDLFAQIRSAPKQFLQRQNISQALERVLAGEVPTRGEIVLLEEMFGTPLARAILGKRTFGAKAREAAMDAINLPRAINTAWDASAPFRQGVVLAVGHPVRFTQNIVTMFKSMARERIAVAIDDAIRAHPNFELFTGSGRRNPLFIAERTAIGRGLAAREEAYMSRLAQKVPGIRVSERGYVTFLNKLRMDVANDVYAGWQRNAARGPRTSGVGRLVDRLTGGGKPITERDLDELMLFLNRATGRGGLGSLEDSAPILNATFFSPRLQASRVSLPLSLATSTPRVRALVAKDLAAFVGTGLTVLGMLSLSDDVDVEIDPRSSDFGKIRVGKTRLDFWGGFQTIARFMAQLITNERRGLGSGSTIGLNRIDTVGRFLQSKLGPPAGLAVDLLTGRTFLGEELTPTLGGAGGVLKQVYDRMFPFFLQDMIDAVREQGLTGGFLALPGGLGFSVQTFGTVEDISQRDFNVPFTELWPFEKDMARATFSLENDRTSQGYFARIEELDDGPQGLNAQLNELAQSSLTARQKRNEYFDITAEFANRRNEAAVAAFGNEGIDFDPNEEDDNKRALGEYYQALELSKTAAGRFTTAEWNRRLDALVNQWTFGQREYVRANTHTRDVPDRLLRILPATTRRRIRQSEESRDAQLRRRGVLP